MCSILYRRKAMRIKSHTASQKSSYRIFDTISSILSRIDAILSSHHFHKNHKLSRLGSDSL